MDQRSQAALDLLRKDDRVAWVVEQVTDSFAEGIAQSAKERAIMAHADFFVMSDSDVSARERTKREKYETSRPYQEAEKLELIRFALKEVFVTLPKVQEANAKWLRDLGSDATTIEFDTPDNEERVEGSYAQSLTPDQAVNADLDRRFSDFIEKMTP
jgi:hypothetical protein